jgi:hypothetical protein
MIPDAWAWTVWSLAFLAPWAILYGSYPHHRRAMLSASVFTAPFGLTEPLFVPEYWSPPSLFDLARTTGFDLESLVFSFAIGGVGAVLYNIATRKVTVALPEKARRHPRHRFHRWILALPFLIFVALLPLGWNAIYPGILAMIGGALATAACRPDLRWNVILGGGLFLGYYVVFLVGLEVTAPGYIERVWNLDALSGVRPFGLPIEELLFAIGFGAYWAGVYEHFTWHAASPLRPAASPPAGNAERGL